MHQVCRPLGLIWLDLWSEKLFRIGVLLKIILIVTLTPIIQQEWFIPFIVNWIENPSISPWLGHISNGGDLSSFPYGIIMFVVHLPMTIIGWLFDNLYATDFFINIFFSLTLIAADILLLLVLLQIFENYWKKVIIFYWLSPLVIFITYWHGQLDLIPVTILVYSLSLIKRGNYSLAGIFLAFSIAAKHTMIISFPFIFLYLWTNNGINKELQRFLIFFIISLFVVEVPFILSDAFRLMVLSNLDSQKLYWLFIEMGDNNFIYLIPLVFALLLYFFWRIRRVNFDFLLAILGVAFSIFIIMTPDTPGWYLWLVPIFTLHQCRYGSGAISLISIFSFAFITYHIIYTSGASFILFDYSLIDIFYFEGLFFKSLHYTIMMSLSLLICIQILREGIRENDYYMLGNKPLVLGIAGDSGVGKSTFSSGLANVFSGESLAEISGDDYHNWERSSPMWRTLTHLNPKANRLFELIKNVRDLIHGEGIKARYYDHISGRFLPREIKKNTDIILVEGLHTLYPRQLLEQLDVRLFIDMDETLREFLSIKRNSEDRGHSKNEVIKAFEKRRNDSDKYIKPQAERADIIFSLLLINKDLFQENHTIDSNIKLRVTIKNGIYYDELVRVLIGVCGLTVNIDSVDERGEVILEISGEVFSEDINLAISILVPHANELLDFSSKFSSGINGIMQIITFIEIDEALKRRRN